MVNDNNPLGETYTYECAQGFEYLDDNSDLTTTCQAGGSWSPAPPTCTGQNTHRWAPFTNIDTYMYIIFIYTVFVYFNILLSCLYKSLLENTIILSTGCDAPGGGTYTVEIVSQAPYTLGQTVTYECQSGFEFLGDQVGLQRSCETGGSWSGEPPACTGMQF